MACKKKPANGTFTDGTLINTNSVAANGVAFSNVSTFFNTGNYDNVYMQVQAV
jgi:hypothetical protein